MIIEKNKIMLLLLVVVIRAHVSKGTPTHSKPL